MGADDNSQNELEAYRPQAQKVAHYYEQ